MIIVDGRTDIEKLEELMAGGAEERELDFKATLNLSGGSSKDVLAFVKDCISMANLPDGGYIVVGVDDQGRPAHDQAEIIEAHFDSATLRARVTPYVDAPINIVSQIHTISARRIVIISIRPNSQSLPIPTSAVGQYSLGSGKNCVVFHDGEVLIREGTSNVRLRYSHWPELLERYTQRIRAEALEGTNQLIKQVVSTMRETSPVTGVASVPLALGMSPSTLAGAIRVSLDANETSRLRRLLNSAKSVLFVRDFGVDSAVQALDAVCILAIEAIEAQQTDVFNEVIKTLQKVYMANAPTDWMSANLAGDQALRAGNLLAICLRLYAIGSFAIRQEAWSFIPSLVERPVTTAPEYVYATWLRHAGVMAARANLLPPTRTADRHQLITSARKLAVGNGALRPDVPDMAIPAAEALADDDVLLNSLCQFDLLWCLVVEASHPDEHGRSFYPSCAMFHQYRVQPLLAVIISDESMRRAAFGEQSDRTIAAAMVQVIDVATRESSNYGGEWNGLDGAGCGVRRFVEISSV